MPGAAVGAILGFVLSGTGLGVGLAGFLGVSAGTLWMIGASIGSLFDAPSLDIGGSTPNYAFGALANTKSQLLPIPIVYGRCRVGGNVFMQTFYDDSMQKMDMFVGVSEGPIQSIKSIYANDVILIDGNGDVVHELEDTTLNLHLGASDQVADSRDPGGNAYPNTAYVALTLKAQDGLTGNPVISSIVEGRKVWTPSGTVFSRNPAWIVYDFLANTRYGVGIPTDLIDLPSFTAAAAYCDHPIDGEPRFTLDYIIDTQRPAIDHLQAMLGCFRGFFLARDKIELHVEQTGSVYKALTPDNFVKNSFMWWQKSGDDSPNRIIIEWIDPNNHYEQSSAPFEIQEDIIARGVYEKSFSLLGVTRPEQVGRLGNYLLETARRVQNFCSFQVSLQDADIEAGEIVSITYPDFTGWSAKPFRVLAVQDEGQTGNVILTCAEYDAAVYSDDGLNVESPIQDTPPVTYDDVYALALEDVGHIEGDGTWVPVIRATWQNPSDYTPTAINVRWRYAVDEGETENEWALHVNSTRLITQTNIPSLETGKTVEIWVNCVRPDTGKETTGKTADIIVGRDTEAPDAPTGLTATGWFGSIILEWINPTNPDLSHIEIWENAVDDRDTAVKIADAKGTTYMRYLGSFQGRYYWIRAVDTSGNISQWNAEAGVHGYSDQETHQDFVDLILEENPYLQEAINDLNTGIGEIETNLSEIQEIVLPSGVNAVAALSDRLSEVEVDLPGAVQRLAERIGDINADVMDQLRSVSEGAVDALLNISEIGQRITDAGIVVDPETGEVRIWAVDQLRTEHGVRLANAEQLISAQEARITQKVSLAEVDSRIAQAVFGDVGELLVSGLDTRISEVEQDLDAVSATLSQKATQVEVDELGGRVGTAETAISGLEASVSLKATQIEVDSLGSRVSSAEMDIDALNGTISQGITAIGQEGTDLANLTAEGLVEAILNDADNRELANVQIAAAKQELSARIEEGIEAEAGQRLDLAALVAGNYAELVEEKYVRATQNTSLASSLSQLEVEVGDNTAAILEESEVRANQSSAQGQYSMSMLAQLTNEAAEGIVEDILNQADGREVAKLQYALLRQDYEVKIEEGISAEASKRELLSARVDDNEGAISQESRVRATQDEALAQQTTILGATVGDNTAAIQTEAETRATADTALANRIEIVEADVGDNLAAIQEESQARATADEAFASQIETIVSEVGDNAAAIQTEAETRATQDSSLAQQITTVQSTANGNTASIQTLDSAVDGIKAKRAVKVDVGGYVVGYELIGTGSSGSMIFHVDNFLVGRPGTTNRYPFVIGTVDGTTRVSIDNAFIQDGAIKNAKIQNLTIGRIKLASGADAGLSWGAANHSNTKRKYVSGNNTVIYPPGCDVSITTESRGRVIVMGYVMAAYEGGSSYDLALYRNGVYCQAIGDSSNMGEGGIKTFNIYYVDSAPINGTSTYKIRLKYNWTALIHGIGISALALYR